MAARYRVLRTPAVPLGQASFNSIGAGSLQFYWAAAQKNETLKLNEESCVEASVTQIVRNSVIDIIKIFNP